jgi:predicted nucleic acid-binding protein
MILVDSSVWIDHFRRAHPTLVDELGQMRVVTHPFVVGELACGYLPERERVLTLMARLPALQPVSNQEALAFIDAQALAGAGLGWVDVHLLAAARLARVGLLTADKALQRAATRLGLAF